MIANTIVQDTEKVTVNFSDLVHELTKNGARLSVGRNDCLGYIEAKLKEEDGNVSVAIQRNNQPNPLLMALMELKKMKKKLAPDVS